MDDKLITINPETLKLILENTKWWFAIIVSLTLIAWRYFKYIDKKSEHKHKTDRAKNYSQSLDRLSLSITDSNKNLLKSLGVISKKIDTLDKKTKGVLSFSESVNLIKIFFSNFTRYSVDICQKSIKENNFSMFREHIEKRIKTELGSYLVDIRSKFENASIAFNYDLFFISSTSEYDRFILVDNIWEVIEPYYFHEKLDSSEDNSQDLKNRIVATKLSIETKVSDYIQEIVNSIKKESIKDLGEESGIREAICND